MRCLYCGKELALLKRWTGGGEFCSDAHRQRYQEEYNQLALNRLLQAKPPEDITRAVPVKSSTAAEPAAVPYSAPTPEAPPPKASKIAALSEPTPQPPRRDAPRETPRETPSPVAARLAPPVERPAPPEPIAVAPVFEPPTPLEEPPPAEAAGFLVEMPLPALAEVAPISNSDMEFLNAVAAALPNHVFEPLDSRQDTYQLDMAGLVAYQPYNRASDYIANSSRERRLEVRDFLRTAPVVEIELSPAGETGLETSSEAMDILIIPQPPSGLPVLWQQPPVGFSESGTELGPLGRLSFVTVGFSNQDESTESERETAVALAEPLSIEPSSVEIAIEEPEPVIEAHVERHVEIKMEAKAEASVEAAPAPEPAPEPVIQAAIAEPVVEESAEKAPLIPDPVTTPLPVVVNGATPGKAKTVQVFSSASSAIGVQVPRSTSLPLRPAMTFGPAPVKEVEKPVEKATDRKMPERPQPVSTKGEPKKPAMPPAPVRPDPRLANGKFRRPEPPAVKADVKEDRKPAAKLPEPEPAPKQAAKMDIPSAPPQPAKQERKPEVKENVRLKENAPPPAPLAAPYAGSGDLGLPHLNLQAPEGLLSRLPIAAKIGIAAVLVIVIGCLIAFSSKSGGAATTSSGPGTVVAGPALPIGDSGWITDWGADPGVRRTRQISILRSSQTLTDYRIEMQAQIETKAIGWVFRAADSKNFYVTKLEIVKPGLEPTVALVRFAVVNGEEQAHAQLPLPMKVRRDTMYKIQFDAVGNHFTTYVQDEKVDDWTDGRIKTGGVGLYSERGEVASLKGGMNVVPLIVRK